MGADSRNAKDDDARPRVQHRPRIGLDGVGRPFAVWGEATERRAALPTLRTPSSAERDAELTKAPDGARPFAELIWFAATAEQHDEACGVLARFALLEDDGAMKLLAIADTIMLGGENITARQSLLKKARRIAAIQNAEEHAAALESAGPTRLNAIAGSLWAMLPQTALKQ